MKTHRIKARQRRFIMPCCLVKDVDSSRRGVSEAMNL